MKCEATVTTTQSGANGNYGITGWIHTELRVNHIETPKIINNSIRRHKTEAAEAVSKPLFIEHVK